MPRCSSRRRRRRARALLAERPRDDERRRPRARSADRLSLLTPVHALYAGLWPAQYQPHSGTPRMKTRLLIALMGIFLLSARASAQQKTVTGRVTDEAGAPIASASVVIRGTTTGTQTNSSGNYTIRVALGQVLQYRYIGTTPIERTVGAEDVINVQLRRVAATLDAVVTTALGQTAAQRSLGTAQQMVSGPEIAQTQRENFVNALQGRVAGVNVVSSSGVPGASSSITIRGVSSISSSNQPIMIVDGLPMDNKTLNTASVLASEAPGSALGFANRGVDFTNRAADLNPEDIESLVALKGPEASA